MPVYFVGTVEDYKMKLSCSTALYVLIKEHNMVDGTTLPYSTVHVFLHNLKQVIKGVFISDCIVYIKFAFVLYLILILDMSFFYLNKS